MERRLSRFAAYSSFVAWSNEALAGFSGEYTQPGNPLSTCRPEISCIRSNSSELAISNRCFPACVIPAFPEYVSRVAPAVPRLVVTTITPLEPRLPYCAVAEASLSTSTVSKSFGLRLRKLAASIGIPSTIYNGSLPPETELAPRICTRAALPGWPLFTVANKPGTRPCKILSKEALGTKLILSFVTTVAAPAYCDLRTVW